MIDYTLEGLKNKKKIVEENIKLQKCLMFGRYCMQIFTKEENFWFRSRIEEI